MEKQYRESLIFGTRNICNIANKNNGIKSSSENNVKNSRDIFKEIQNSVKENGLLNNVRFILTIRIYILVLF